MWFRLLIEWLVIILTMCIVNLFPNILTVWLGALIVGSRQHALGTIGHWALHKLMPKYKLAQWLTFAPVGVDPAKILSTHWAHHGAISDPVLDPEMSVVTRFKDRWSKLRNRDLLLDALGLHADETILVLSKLMTTPRSLLVYGFTAGAFGLVIGWIATLVWILGSITGLVLCHRLRARTEHDHLKNPGQTIVTSKPSLLRRIIFLPHFTWLHAEHHAAPSKKVWLS